MTTLRLTQTGLYVEQRPSFPSRIVQETDEESVLYDANVVIENMSLTSSSSSSQDSIESETPTETEGQDQLGPQILRDPKACMQMRPFEMRWCFGFNNEVPIINLTTEESTEVMYVSNNIFVRYDYVNRKMSFFQAHQNKICTLSYEQDKRFVVTADKGPNHCMIVWDTRRIVPIYTAFDPYPESGVLLVGMDPTGRYIVSVGEATDYSVDFWLWTTGNQQPSGTIKVKINRGYPQKVSFNPDKPELVMVVFEAGVLFFQWDEESREIINATNPTIRNKSKIGSLTSGTFVSRCHECYAASNQGYILKFGIALYTKPFSEHNIGKVFINAVKISKGAVTCMRAIDDKILIGDSLGNLQYFDKGLKILYWQINLELPAINYVSISKSRKRFSFSSMGKEETITITDKSKIPVPKSEKEYTEVDGDISFDESCIDCLISTGDGNIYALDTMHNKCHALLDPTEDYICAIDTHTARPYLLIGCHNGRLYLYNYLKCQVITSKLLPEPLVEDEEPTLTCLKYCSQSINLVCGRSNGEIVILNPILLTPRQVTFRISQSGVKKIAFSADSLQFAYIDTAMTTFLFMYDKTDSEWAYRARIRAHYKDITDIMFSPIRPFALFTLGSDRCFMVYNNSKMKNMTLSFEASKTRIEQTAIPHNMMWYPLYDESTKSGFVLIADNQHKFKLFNDDTLLPCSTALGPAYGCYNKSPVHKMVLVPRTKGKYMAFMSRKHIGLQLLPADGNPYKFIGCSAHQEELLDMVLSYCGNYAFTFGVEDKSVFMWNIRLESVKTLQKIGGTGMEPYYCLLEGGKNGWLFREMQDLFYYMQVLDHGEDSVLPRKVTDTIPISELPDLVRACGFYPSDFETENMMIDIKHRGYIENNTDRERISFLEFVQLYINHRPPYGYTMADLENAFDTVAMAVDNPDYGSIQKDNFVDLMVNLGETFTEENLAKCLAVLLGESQEDDDDVNFDFVPEDIDFSTFTEDILGIDMERRELEEVGEENQV